MKVFQVINPGLFTTVQDSGRYGYLKYGVPISGAMDQFSLAAANCLIGNDPADACLETTLIGPELQVFTKTQIAITGGNCSSTINGEKAPMWETLTVQEGDIVSLGKTTSGCRSYLSMRGGVNTPVTLGSRSTYTRGGFGGIEGRQLKTGDSIEGIGPSLLGVEYSVPEELVPSFTNRIDVQVILGPQADMFRNEGIETFLSSQYTVTPESDRMGYRLEGPLIAHKEKADIVSDALLPGAIQVPRNGKPIVIMRDAQTTGGYPKIAMATAPSLSALAQARPNDTIQFSKTTLKEAHEKLREHHKLLNALKARLVRNG